MVLRNSAAQRGNAGCSRLVPCLANHLHRASTFFLNWLPAGFTVVFIGLTSTARPDPEKTCRHDGSERACTKRQLKCDLKGTCGDLFGVEIADKLKGEVRSPDDRESSGAEQAADLQLQVTYGKASALQLEGHIEFSTLDCGEEVCPIYLEDVDLSQAQASWPVLLDLGAFGRIDKQVSNVHARLARPALGIALEDGQIAFPAEALLFRVEVDVAGATHLLLENGKQSFWMRNPEVVLGRLVDGSLELKMDLPTEFGRVQVKAYAER